jgi:hypothetical protein
MGVEGMMNQAKNRVLLGVVAIGLLLCSIPTTWMTFKNASLSFDLPTFGDSSPFGQGGPMMQMPAFNGLELNVTGINGHITLGAKAPIWLLVIVAAGAIGVGALNAAGITTVPSVIPLVVLGVVGIFFAAGLFVIFGGDATMGIGYPLAIVGYGLGFAQLIRQLNTPSDQTIA